MTARIVALVTALVLSGFAHLALLGVWQPLSPHRPAAALPTVLGSSSSLFGEIDMAEPEQSIVEEVQPAHIPRSDPFARIPSG